MPAIAVVSDASVVLKWFHDEGEQEAAEARALLDAHRNRLAAVSILDLTYYEIGNALLRGRAAVGAGQVATVLDSLAEICPVVRVDPDDLRLAAELAEQHGLTMYDAAYAAVAKSRGATLATADEQLLEAGLGILPGELVARLN